MWSKWQKREETGVELMVNKMYGCCRWDLVGFFPPDIQNQKSGFNV